MMINLNGEQVCALLHLLEDGLVSEKWIANSTGGGKWVPSHSSRHRLEFKVILEKLNKNG